MPSLSHLFSSRRAKHIILAAFIGISMFMWFLNRIYEQYYVSTDDAYVNAAIIPIAPRINGKVIALYIQNNQFVKEGTPLFALDPEPFELALAAAKAQVEINEALVDESTIQATRTMALVKHRYASTQAGDSSQASLKTAHGKLALAKAELAQALLNMRYTTVAAPTAGWITNDTLEIGTLVNANQPVFALVSQSTYWVDANFKETEIANIKPGQLATITLDTYPQHPYEGVVDSISNGTGAAFSLLPPQNATGNWVKVTQRIPIKIRILHPDGNYPLRIGASAYVKIHLRQFIKKIP